MDESLIKAEKDYSKQLDKELPEISKLPTDDAIDRLLQLEKKIRQASDLASSKRVLTALVDICAKGVAWKRLCELIVVLSKKHGQLKMATQAFVQKVIDELPEEKSQKVEVIDTIRQVSEGRIFLELERARVTRTLAYIKLDEGDVATAADLLGELQVETFGSMKLTEKTEFILEQIELYIKKGDYSYAQIISRKILPRYFQEKGMAELKRRYYELLVQIDLHEDNYLGAALSLRQIYDDSKDDVDRHSLLKSMVLLTVLSPVGPEQQDMLHRLSREPDLPLLSLFDQVVRMFIADELIRWPRIVEVYGNDLRLSWVFSPGEEGERRWESLHSRNIEHNIRVVAKFYSRITLDALAELLDLGLVETEHTLAGLVTNGTVWARIDRPNRIVSFSPPKEANDILNEWSSNTDKLLGHIETIGHLIAKDEMMHGIRQRN